MVLPCDQGGKPVVQQDNPKDTFLSWTETATQASPSLFLSNGPETVPEGTSNLTTLYRYRIRLSGGVDFPVRCFIWHGHRAQSDRWIQLAIRPSGGNISIVNHRVIHRVRRLGLLHEMGACISKALLGQTLDAQPSYGILNGVTFVLAASLLIPPEVRVNGRLEPHYYGAIREFTIQSNDEDIDVDIWTCIVNNPADVTPHDSLVTPNSSFHPRGFWPYSDISTTRSGTANLTQLDGLIQLKMADANGPDAAKFVWRGATLDPHGSPASGNKGLYGVVSQYTFQYLHTYNENPTVDYSLVGRGGRFFGTMTANPEGKTGVPPIGPQSGSDEPYNRCRLRHFVLEQEGVAAIERVVVGGAASTPAALVVEVVT